MGASRLLFGAALLVAAGLAAWLLLPVRLDWARYDQGLGINATFPVGPTKKESQVDGGHKTELRLFRGPSEAAESGRPQTYDRDQLFSVAVLVFPDEKLSQRFEDEQAVRPGGRG